MSMLHRGQLNPGDVTVLHQIYSNDDPPPVQLLHVCLLLLILVYTFIELIAFYACVVIQLHFYIPGLPKKVDIATLRAILAISG